jgi:hypothetical protein
MNHYLIKPYNILHDTINILMEPHIKAQFDEDGSLNDNNKAFASYDIYMTAKEKVPLPKYTSPVSCGKEIAAMTNEEIEAEIELIEVRKYTPQWEAYFRGKQIARITERVIKTPPISVVRIVDEKDAGEYFYFSKDHALDQIIEWIKE